MAALRNVIKFACDVVVTLLLWLYFIFGYILFFSPLFILAYLFSSNREKALQGLMHMYCRSFFGIVRLLVPRLSIHVQPDVRSLHSAVVVCNHLSYLDPMLLIAIFKNQKTIVKRTFFKLPIFGQILKASGYIPSAGGSPDSKPVLDRIENMGNYLSSGGILFIFPEGTRSRNGKIGRFHTGAFKIANRFRYPLKVLAIRNTQHLFRPGSFLFDSAGGYAIEVELLGTIDPAVPGRRLTSLQAQMQQMRTLLENGLAADLKENGKAV